MPDDDINIIVRGRVRTIEYALCDNDVMPAKAFFDKLHLRDQQWLNARFNMLANSGDLAISNEDIFRRERKLPDDITGTGGWLWSFKKETKRRPGGGLGLIRIPCFLLQRRWILTTGFWKTPSEPEWPETRYSESFRIIREALNRERRRR
jgi:hypothetical protein